MAVIQIDCLAPPKSAGKQECQECAIPYTLQRLSVRRIPEPLRVPRSQPVAESDADLPDTLHAPYAGCQVWAQQAALGRLVREAAHYDEPKIDRARRQMPGFQVDTVPEDNGLAER